VWAHTRGFSSRAKKRHVSEHRDYKVTHPPIELSSVCHSYARSLRGTVRLRFRLRSADARTLLQVLLRYRYRCVRRCAPTRLQGIARY